ncbi:MAG: hypothetical protein SF029_11480 [bacterium]|nr:hypothetical protein [bacterium]
MTTELRDHSNVIFIEASDPLTLMDFNDSFARQKEIMDKSTEKVHLFVTVQGLRNMPNGILRVRDSAPIFSHPKAGNMVIVGASALIRALAGMSNVNHPYGFLWRLRVKCRCV